MSAPMSHLPKRGTKHIPKHREAVGTIRDGKIKVRDGDTGKESWRSGRSGVSADWDGDAIAHNFDKESLEAFKQDGGNLLSGKSTKDTKRPLGTQKPIS